MAFGEDLPPPDWKEALQKANLDSDSREEIDRFDECRLMWVCSKISHERPLPLKDYLSWKTTGFCQELHDRKS